MCVCVWVGVWYMCVHICIIYISNIYYIYLYHISVEGCHGDQPQYICNSFHHPNLSCTFIQDFLVSHQKLILGRGRGTRRGDMGNSLILMKSNVCVTGWLHFGSMLNCEDSDELMKSWVTCNPLRSVLCVCFVSGAENDNLPTVPLFGVGSALESYCKCLACIITPSRLTSELAPPCFKWRRCK